jgi:hypothetical protein
MTLREREQARSQRARRSHQAQTKRSRRKRQRSALAAPLAMSDDAVLTFAQWCKLNNIGERNGRRIIKSGNGPVVLQLSERRIGIRVGDNRRWQEARARG